MSASNEEKMAKSYKAPKYGQAFCLQEHVQQIQYEMLLNSGGMKEKPEF